MIGALLISTVRNECLPLCVDDTVFCMHSCCYQQTCSTAQSATDILIIDIMSWRSAPVVCQSTALTVFNLSPDLNLTPDLDVTSLRCLLGVQVSTAQRECNDE